MFFTASIALTFILALSGVANGAPLTQRTTTDDTLQFCTGINGTGTCTPLEFSTTDSSQNPLDGNSCTNVSNAKSIIMEETDICTFFEFDNCEVEPEDEFKPAHETFPSDATTQDLPDDVKSISCIRVPGLVDGLFPQ